MERWIRNLLAGILAAVLLMGTASAEAAVGGLQSESVSGEISGDTVGEIASEYGQEEYTDTDMRRGILAVRMEAFEGFHGTAELTVCGKESGREWRIILKQEAFYQANQELPVGEYRISGILAVSEGRAFDCLIEPAEISLSEGKTTFCRVSVFPGSVYQVPYEAGEMEGVEPEIEEGSNGEDKLEDANGKEQQEQNLAEAGDGERKDAEWNNAKTGNEKTGREGAERLEDQKTNGKGSMSAQGETGENNNLEADGGTTENGVPAAFVAGLTGFIGCAVWIFRLITKKREGGV